MSEPGRSSRMVVVNPGPVAAAPRQLNRPYAGARPDQAGGGESPFCLSKAAEKRLERFTVCSNVHRRIPTGWFEQQLRTTDGIDALLAKIRDALLGDVREVTPEAALAMLNEIGRAGEHGESVRRHITMDILRRLASGENGKGRPSIDGD